jgi:biopolymer transport protein TolQ
MSFFSIFHSTDLVGKAVLLVLFLSSCYSGSVIALKVLQFLNVYKLGTDLKTYVEEKPEIVKLSAEPSIYFETYNLVVNNFDSEMNLEEEIKQSSRKWVQELEAGLDYLAILGSIAPFIGLFGTVLGIMHSFQAIASSNSTNISVVAPAISEALFVTAFGIFVAIPANFFAHIFYSKIDFLEKDQLIFAKYLEKRLKQQFKR